MLNKLFFCLLIINSLLSSDLYAGKRKSKGDWENSLVHIQGKHHAKQYRDTIFDTTLNSKPLQFRRNTHLIVQLLLLATIMDLVSPPTDLSASSSSPKSYNSDLAISQSHRSSPDPYFFPSDPIPLQNRTHLFDRLEAAYRQGEVCEPETFTVISALPHTHPLQEPLKQCGVVNTKYKSPQILPGLNILFNKEIPHPQFKVVPQFFYSTSNDKILFTGNVMKCVAIAIYNPALKRGGLAHAAGENIAYLDKHLQSKENDKTGIHEFMEAVAGTIRPAEQRVTILSGSKAHIEYYLSFMKSFGFADFNIIQEDEWGSSKNNFYNKNLNKGSLALDTTDGNIYRIENDNFVSQWMGAPESFHTWQGNTMSVRLKRK